VVKASDFDQDGDIDLFVGERFKTNLYGLPGAGYLLQNDGNGKFNMLDMPVLKDIGMITDASWSDINDDGWDDLILVGEWMPIQVFINTKGSLEKSKHHSNLDQTAGLWTALEVIDIDKDGDQDIIAGNLGQNNYYQQDMRMYVADFDGNGFQEQLICKKLGTSYYPIVDKDELISQIPSLKKKLVFYSDYAKATMKSLFSEEILNTAYFVDLKMLNSTVFFNENNTFTPKSLPNEIQYAPVYAVTCDDVNNDGYTDLFLGGNQDLVKPQFGSYNGSKGWGILGPIKKNKDYAKPFTLNIEGQIRDLQWITYKDEKTLIAPLNNDKTRFYKIDK